jgi:hypothetical protein
MYRPEGEHRESQDDDAKLGQESEVDGSSNTSEPKLRLAKRPASPL